MSDILKSASNTGLRKKPSEWMRVVEEATGRPLETPRPVSGVVELLLDVSGSMEGRKLQDAIEGAIGFAKEALLKGYSVGVIRFSGTASNVCEPSQNIEEITRILRQLEAEDETKIAPALSKAYERLKGLSFRKAVVLFTDGQTDDETEALKRAAALKTLPADIITIGTDDADLAFLRRLATSTELSIATETRQLGSAIRASARLLKS